MTYIIFPFKKYIGDVSLVKDTQTVVNEIANRGPIHYRVRFPVQDPLPKLTAIYYNNELLCSEQVPQQTCKKIKTNL